jgi:hypothetical protein
LKLTAVILLIGNKDFNKESIMWHLHVTRLQEYYIIVTSFILHI